MGTTQRRLVNSEYIDARYLYAALHVLKRMEKHKARWKLSENGWQRYRVGVGMLEKAVDAFEATIPEEDKRKVKADLNNTDIYLHTTRIAEIKVDDSDMVFVTRNHMHELIGYALQGCELCDKCGKDVIKCKKRKALHAIFPHELPIFNGEGCLWDDYGIDSEDGRELMIRMTWEDADRQNQQVREAESG